MPVRDECFDEKTRRFIDQATQSRVPGICPNCGKRISVSIVLCRSCLKSIGAQLNVKEN